MQQRHSTPSQEARFFSGTLSETRAPTRYLLSAPLGLTVHGFALAAIVLTSMLAVPEPTSPRAQSTTVLQFAPPPAPPLLRGAGLETTPARVVEADAFTFDPIPSIEIPEEMLTTTVLISDTANLGNGFEGGDPNGLTGGMPQGVVGGVPGGLAGGVIGGTGTELPDLPKPDVGPKPIRMPPAMFTKEAARHRVRGSVKLRVIIDERGKVEVLEVLRSIPELDAEAIRTVESSWRFEPATKNGRPIPCLSDLVVRFNLY